MQPEPREEIERELDWLAFRYVAGEMNPAEAAAFENTLAEDQLARDAVCQAVVVSERLAAAPSEVSRPLQQVERASPHSGIAKLQQISRMPALRAAGWMAIGAAAALLIVYFARPVDPAPRNVTPRGRSPLAGAHVDAVVWARLQTSSQWADEQVQQEEGAELGNDEFDTSLEPDVLDGPQVHTLPDWMSGPKPKKRGSQRGNHE